CDAELRSTLERVAWRQCKGSFCAMTAPLRFLLPALAATFACALLTACHKHGSSSSAPPVVRQAPVFTRPFEDGYAAGYGKGKAAGKFKAKLPEEDEVLPKA